MDSARMGAEDDAGRLGFGVLGDAAWDAQARVRLRLGPLSRAQYDAFLPGGPRTTPCARWRDSTPPTRWAWMRSSCSRAARCRRAGSGRRRRDGPAPPRLGRGTWLASPAARARPRRDDAPTLLNDQPLHHLTKPNLRGRPCPSTFAR